MPNPKLIRPFPEPAARGSSVPEPAARGEGSLVDVRLVIAGLARRYSTSEVTKTVGVPVLGEIAWDPDAARWWSHGEPQRRFDRSALPRSVVALGESLRALAPRTEDALLQPRAGAER